jgi:hypothetical protein
MIDKPEQRRCWCGTIDQYLGTDPSALLRLLTSGYSTICNENPSAEQVNAWRNCIRALTNSLWSLSGTDGLILEYVLPRERGRRPDVILLTGDRILVLEFKDHFAVRAAYADQAAAYARDLQNYQSSCRGKEVIPIVVLTRAGGVEERLGATAILSPDLLAHHLQQLVKKGSERPNIAAFLQGEYAPLPTLVDAARMLFEHEHLPQIRRAASVGIPETLSFLHLLANEATSGEKKLLALVTGVPGSGKTLVGLQFVYDRAEAGRSNGVFLSGNGPLVEVLQYTLRNKVFVQDVHGFLKQYGGTATQTPSERVWVYDEAQRAWDEPRAQEQRGADSVSEPLDFLRLAARTSGGGMVLALIGEGQEIHIGEEAGIAQWNEALALVEQEWQVACPEHIAHVFETENAKVLPDNRLSLDQSLRTHLASDVQNWVSQLLDGAIQESRMCSEKLWRDEFPIYVTRSLEHAKRYAHEKYLGFEDKRYGLLASSKAKNLERFGIENSFQATRRVKKGPWFVDDPSEPLSCCKLDSVATEFACQGLELDLPIVAWGDD